jgi:hypothetical protein
VVSQVGGTPSSYVDQHLLRGVGEDSGLTSCVGCGGDARASAATGMTIRIRRVRTTRRGLVLRGVRVRALSEPLLNCKERIEIPVGKSRSLLKSLFQVGADESVQMNAVVVRAPVRVLWEALNAVLSDGKAVELPEVRIPTEFQNPY